VAIKASILFYKKAVLYCGQVVLFADWLPDFGGSALLRTAGALLRTGGAHIAEYSL